MKLRFLRRLRLGNRSTAAVEFAIVAPVLLLLLIGTSEMLMLYRTEAKLNELAGNYAQMVSLQDPQNTGVTTGASPATLGDLCTGATYGLQPFPASGLTIAVASLTEVTAAVKNANGVVTTNPTYDYWEAVKSCPSSATAMGMTTVCGLAGANGANSMLFNLDDNVIVARATLKYPGIVGLIVGSAPTLTQTSYARWRYASSLGTPTELTCATGSDCTVSAIHTCP